MKDTAPPSFIDVQHLRIGMYIHLDVGWMAHPFPLSSFKLTTPEQIAIIRGLGKSRLRWSPDKSDPAPIPEQAAGALSGAADDASDLPPGTPAAAPSETPQAAQQRIAREQLATERAALQLCERQFTEAARACKNMCDLVPALPQVARAQAEALAGALVTKMLDANDMCIRLLTDAAGDKAGMHAVNVAVISLLMGRTFGLPESDMLDLGVGALLHDIGKIELPERVRHKDDSFSTAENQLYQEHVAHGVALARKMGLQPGATLVIAQHHEHADGSGFPLKLNSDRMSTGARIVSLINRYDNMCNPAIASKVLTPHEALSLLFAQGKNRYDTAILGAFIRMMGVYPPGSTVQLTDDRFGVVVSVNSSRSLKPRVIVHDPRVPRDEALLLDLEGHGHLGIRRSTQCFVA